MTDPPPEQLPDSPPAEFPEPSAEFPSVDGQTETTEVPAPAPGWDDIATEPPPMRTERADLPPVEPGWDASLHRLGGWIGRILRQSLESWLTLFIVAGGVVFILTTVHPSLLLSNTTPTGGDMGAHVWGPEYLLRHVLPHGRISGWTPDWYAGFPAFRYYMIVPALAIIAVNVGVGGPLVVLAVLAAAAVAVSGFVVKRLFPARKVLMVIGLLLVVVSVPVPYNIAFKLITVAGLLTMPISAWAFAKLADLRFPSPPAFALAALVFVYNREPLVHYPNGGGLIGTGQIIGGNMLSTMAGEYSFSISISLCLLYFGVLVRGLRTGRHRALAAGLLALVGLCHLLPFFFALLATAIFFLVRPSLGRVRWLAAVGLVAGALAAFWMLPFYWYRNYTVDMGFEQLPPNGLGYSDYLFPSRILWMFLLAGIGVVVAFAYRNRVGQGLLGCVLATALAFRFMPQIQLWNARILPFYYLSVMLLAAFGAAGVVVALSTLLARRPGTPSVWIGVLSTALVALAAVSFVGFPLRKLPGQHMAVDGRTHWLWFSSTDQNPAPGWATWNYSGYEGRTAKTALSANPYADYHNLVTTMDRLGKDPAHGCGRAMWETDNDREGEYGTPMALMLLPYWTDSCIGSMEGLYFESSATTPFHFINAAELADKPSNPMRGLPYPGFDLNAGVHHLQLLGVKYYLADTPSAFEAAKTDASLTLVATSGPWRVYQIADSELVVPMTHQPAVWNVPDQAVSSVQPAVAWYLDPTRWDVPFASEGPADWKRVQVDTAYWNKNWSTLTDVVAQMTGKTNPSPLPRVDTPAVPKANVSGIVATTNTISFDVDRIGTPIQVKTSYYPNWQVRGAKGPYRITPNQMVVIPTSNHVELHYGTTWVERWGNLLLIAGLVALVVLSRLAPVAVASPLWSERADRRRARNEKRRDNVPAGPWPDGGPPIDPDGGPVVDSDAGHLIAPLLGPALPSTVEGSVDAPPPENTPDFTPEPNDDPPEDPPVRNDVDGSR